MATVEGTELATILNGGGINTIFLGGTASTDKLVKKSELDVIRKDIKKALN